MTPSWRLSAVLALPIFHEDRAAAIKSEQLATIAAAVDEAAAATKWPGAPSELRALMLTVAFHESALSLRIHAGDCRKHECDRGRARGLWQQHASSASSREAWEQLAGLDAESTRHAAREAARSLARARWQCRSLEKRGQPWLEMTLSAYAGRGCVGWFRGRDARVATYVRIIRRTS